MRSSLGITVPPERFRPSLNAAVNMNSLMNIYWLNKCLLATQLNQDFSKVVRR